jgi:hypothetical protein
MNNEIVSEVIQRKLSERHLEGNSTTKVNYSCKNIKENFKVSAHSSSSINRLYYYYTTPYIRAFLTFKIVITDVKSCFSS